MTVASARKGNGWGEQGEGKASPGPRNPGWGGRAPGSPPRRHPRALGAGPRASSHSPKLFPFRPPSTTQPSPAVSRRIPQLLAFLPRSHPRHLQSIARSLKIRRPPPILEHKTAFFTGMLRGGSHPAPPGGHRPARRCAQRGAQPPHAPRAPSPRPCPGPELSHSWLRAEASHRGPSPPLAVRLPGE